MINASCVVLNSTFEPLSIIPTKRALMLCLQNKATVLQSYDYKVKSPSVEHSLPSTIALKQYIKTRKLYTKRAMLNKRNIFIRDDHQCQYCGRGSNQLKTKEELTVKEATPVVSEPQDNEETNLVVEAPKKKKRKHRSEHRTPSEKARRKAEKKAARKAERKAKRKATRKASEKEEN